MGYLIEKCQFKCHLFVFSSLENTVALQKLFKTGSTVERVENLYNLLREKLLIVFTVIIQQHKMLNGEGELV